MSKAFHATCRWTRSSYEGLDGFHRVGAPARLPAARRASARGRPRDRDHGARLRADAPADRVARHDRDGDRPSRRALRRWQGTPDAYAPASAAQMGARPRVRCRPGAWLTRVDHDRAAARHPVRDDVRLRVGVVAASARLPRGDARRRARLDPSRTARDLRREAAEASAVPRAEGGVLPLGLRAGPVGAHRLGTRRGARARRAAATP